jgi:glycosyltransferase involved in cell wall biosynthesis
MNLKLSIITINLNNKAGLQRTVESVQNQTSTNFEHIVIDGHSKDGSKEYIEANKEQFDYFVSEPDFGVYNAMNKGIKKAKGDYLFFLNSGDEFINADSLENISKNLNEKDIIYFNINRIGENNVGLKTAPEKLSFSYLHNDLPPHQSTFIKKGLFDTIGGFDESLKIVADWKFLITALIKHNASYKYVNEVHTNFYLGGISSSPESEKLMNEERERILNSEFPILMNDLKRYFELNRILRNLRKSKKLKLLVKLGFIDKF